MDTKQAKDFLVEQAAEQAVIENLPLADIEKRMMYFTESDPTSCPDPFALNDEFEAQFDNAKYEAKMSKLLDHAHKRLRKEDPERARIWDESLAELRKGDHYILILLGLSGAPVSIERPKHDFLKLIGTALLLVVGFAAAGLMAAKFNLDFAYWSRPLFIVGILAWVIFSRPGRQLLAVLFSRRK
jgi:uncharacterized integral membrane protein